MHHPFFTLLLLTLALDAARADWPRWRGPGNNGSIDAGTYATDFSGDRNLAWKIELPGRGYSTPIVIGERIILTAPVEGQDCVLCFDRDGKLRWQTALGPERKGKNRNGTGSNPSAVSDGKGIYVYFKSGTLAGLDLEGGVKWQHKLQERFGKDTLYWDLGTSPVLAGGKVVVAVMHKGESFLAAFDQATGEDAWKTARNYRCQVEGDHSYATPIVTKQGGSEQIITWGAEHVTAHDAGSGKLLWECGGFNPELKRNWVAVASHVMAGDIAVVPYGRGSMLAGIRGPKRLWEQKLPSGFVPSPVEYQGKVYLVGDKGEVNCIDPVDGKVVWSGRFPKGSPKYYASPMIANGILYAPREDGVVMVARIYPAFEFVAENDMGEKIIASPVPLDNRLLLRGDRYLYCVAAP